MVINRHMTAQSKVGRSPIRHVVTQCCSHKATDVGTVSERNRARFSVGYIVNSHRHWQGKREIPGEAASKKRENERHSHPPPPPQPPLPPTPSSTSASSSQPPYKPPPLPHQNGGPVAARHDARRRGEEEGQEGPEGGRVARVRVLLVVGAPVVERHVLHGGEVSGEGAEGEQDQAQDDAADGGQREEQENGRRGIDVPFFVRFAGKTIRWEARERKTGGVEGKGRVKQEGESIKTRVGMGFE